MSSGEVQETLFETLHSAAASSGDERSPRDHVLDLGVLAGNLCSTFLEHAPPDPKREPLMDTPAAAPSPTDFGLSSIWNKPESHGYQQMAQAMGHILWSLVLMAETCQLNLRDCILSKMLLNQKKYPVDLAKGKSGKYTAYSHHTGITKTEGQSTVDQLVDQGDDGPCSVEQVTAKIRNFATERLWSRYHTPRSLVLALMGELGELAELFQWRGDQEDDRLESDVLDKIGQELADVTIYLLRLADVCCIVDVGALALSQSKDKNAAE